MNRAWIVSMLAIAVIVSSLSVVYAQHQSRKLFIELDNLKKERDAMNVEWGQLQLEQSTLATHRRIEEIAREKLGMSSPEYNEVLIVSP